MGPSLRRRSLRPEASGPKAGQARQRPRLGQVIGSALREFYDHLWLASGLSLLLWVSLLPLLVGLWRAYSRTDDLTALALGLLGLITFAAALSAVLFLLQQALRREAVWVHDFLRSFPARCGRTVLLSVANFLFAAVGLVDLFFYLQAKSFLIAVMGAAWLYLSLFWLLVQLYAYPAAVDTGALASVKRAALLVLDNLWFTLGMAAIIGVVTAAVLLPLVLRIRMISGLSLMLIVFVMPALVVFVTTQAYLLLVESYRTEHQPLDFARGGLRRAQSSREPVEPQEQQ